MESAKNLNAAVTDWLAKLVSGQRVAFTHSAQRFAALLSSESELEVARPDAPVAAATLNIGTGASLKLTADQYSIGCAEDCDIVLRDSHIAAHHCGLIRGWAGFAVRDLRSKPARLVTPTDVKYDGGSIDVHYEVGGLQFVVRQPPPAGLIQESGATDAPPASRAVVLALVVGVLVAAVALAIIGRVEKQRSALEAQQIVAPSGGLNEKAATRLMEEARMALADDHLKVELHEGRLLVEGRTVQTALKARIQALATDLRGTIPVEDRVTYLAQDEPIDGPGPLPIRVQSVMVGQPAYFITDTGARYFVGGVMPDGAEVAAISAGEIQFTRAGHAFVYKLQ
jgi:hypothetical protein